MAGKKRTQVDVTSKTAKRSVGTKKDQSFVPAAQEHMNRIVSLNNGQNFYIFDLQGKTHHVKVGSERYEELVAQLAEKGYTR